MKIDTSSLVQVAEVVERELDRLQAAGPYPYSRIESAEDIPVADLVCKRTATRHPWTSDTI